MKKFVLFLMGLTGLAGVIFWWWKPISSPENAALPLPENAQITRLLVLKSERKMLAYENNQLLKSYDIALGFNPIGHKQFEGDGKTPEGIYRINERNPNSAYHKNLGISYPNQKDKDYAQSQGKSAGGLIKIHGIKNGLGAIGRNHLRSDWTHGCIAVTNEEIDELFRHVIHNAEIEIRP
ncbi:L,D-transpeptidase family protein [Wielerella bovis]|uniref:L,D-transpeptidase family protein n=1 Tax=Wielerella bovis TaxID=2917790 RepID=UPI0020192C31|nr:L,D-transpeptidase family protein [Wielerella bovis]MCG7656524.1 L,D-transpeptidase family protein [Wielerella bovis]MCG7658749.1 L,D-transpeptidase family protein [Wielerella bovis]ULJ63013.1 L,D-transpeptidase family protein [Wielerella bovis]ULJ65244.1 L,D-transpeptidase family protein [Wielerella bovis]ULJ67591.1 L,D-transpeptidase family protein [Wielerella bovis]